VVSTTTLVHPLKLVLWSDKKWLHTHSLSMSVV